MNEWKKVKLRDLFERVTRKNANLESDNVLTISAQYGLINQEEFFNKSVAGKNLKNYYLLKKGEFAYNKSYSDGYPMGATKMLEKYDYGVVSTLYICFKSKSELVNNEYFKYYFESKQYYDELSKIAQEGARNHGLLNVSIEDFFNIKISVPTIDEQIKITKIVNKIDVIIDKMVEKKQKEEMLKLNIMDQIFKQRIKFKDSDGKYYRKWIDNQVKNCLKYEQPNKYIVSNTEYNDKNSTPVLTANKGFILGYTNETNNIYEKGDVILYDDFTMDIKYVDFPFKIKSSAMKLLTQQKGIDLKFMYYLLQQKKLQPDVHARTYISKVELMNVKIPEIEEQRRISSLLDLIDKKILTIQKLIDEYKVLKGVVMQKLLTGKVKVNV